MACHACSGRDRQEASGSPSSRLIRREAGAIRPLCYFAAVYFAVFFAAVFFARRTVAVRPPTR